MAYYQDHTQFFIMSQPNSGVRQLGTIRNLCIENWVSIQQVRGGVKFLIWFLPSTPTTITVWEEGFPAKGGRTIRNRICLPKTSKATRIPYKWWQAYAGAVESAPGLLSCVWFQPVHPESWLAQPLSGSRDSPSSSAIGNLLFWSIHDRVLGVVLDNSSPCAPASCIWSRVDFQPFGLRMSFGHWGQPQVQQP
jgi:hypothetical protein